MGEGKSAVVAPLLGLLLASEGLVLQVSASERFLNTRLEARGGPTLANPDRDLWPGEVTPKTPVAQHAQAFFRPVGLSVYANYLRTQHCMQ